MFAGRHSSLSLQAQNGSKYLVEQLQALVLLELIIECDKRNIFVESGGDEHPVEKVGQTSRNQF